MKAIYLCHPLRGKTHDETERNRRRAGALAAIIAERYRVAPVCSWIVLSEFWQGEGGLDLRLDIDCALVGICEEIWLCGPVQPMSEGMGIEHAYAEMHGVKVVDMRGVIE